MKAYPNATSRHVAEHQPETVRTPARAYQAVSASTGRAAAPRLVPSAGGTLRAAETDTMRYGSEYGPYAGVRIHCPTCGRHLDWVLEEDVASDYPVPVGFCRVCRAFVGAGN